MHDSGCRYHGLQDSALHCISFELRRNQDLVGLKTCGVLLFALGSVSLFDVAQYFSGGLQ